ncbi:MAG TPA: glycosyltransferase family 4 protein [Planctomycetaceae bacterium]
MKVLMTADGVGGVWTYAVELARGLGPHGVEILLATSGGPLSDGQRGEIATLPHVRLVETRYKLEWMPDPWEDVAAFGRLLRDLAADFRPDVVHLNEFSHGALGWDVPTLVVGHSCVSSWFESVRGYAPGPVWDRYRKSVTRGLRAADLVAAPTRFMLTALERHYGPFAGSRVLPNGYSPTTLPHPQRRREPFVFAAGRWWDEAKNVAALGRIASRLLWPVRIAGLPAPDGSATALPENIENLGRLGPEAMRERYARAAIYCLPARYEPFGLTPLEAACHGCALVLGDIPSLREVWGDAAAFVPPDDTDSLADTLNRLIADDEARDDLARRGRERAARFSRERMARGYVEAYRELCGAATMSCHQSRSAVTAREGTGALPRGRG